MSEISPTARAYVNASAGHLEVRIEGAHPAEMSFLFEERQKRAVPAAVASLVYHVLFVAAIVFAVRYGSYHPAVTPLIPDRDYSHMVWLNDPGPGGGGGGGGNRRKEPPRKAEAPGKDKLTVQVEKPPQLEMPQVRVEPNPMERLNIPAKSLADAQQSLPGAIEALPGLSALSLGSGTLGGAGTGAGSGVGSGTGSGLGSGSGGGTGGGVYQVGNGVISPVPVCAQYPRGCPEPLMPKPLYTSDAMRARIQGVALVNCVVETDGRPSNCHIVGSLNAKLGLDEQAVVAANQWRFRPGTRQGQPVRVEVVIEMTFNLR